MNLYMIIFICEHTYIWICLHLCIGHSLLSTCIYIYVCICIHARTHLCFCMFVSDSRPFSQTCQHLICEVPDWLRPSTRDGSRNKYIAIKKSWWMIIIVLLHTVLEIPARQKTKTKLLPEGRLDSTYDKYICVLVCVCVCRTFFQTFKHSS